MSDAPAWVKGNVVLAKGLLSRVEEEARAAYGRDEEACGFLVGPADDALFCDEIVPMENRANKLHKLDPETYPRTGRMYFDLDPLKFEKRVAAGKKDGRPVKVLYHSHLDVGAYFSDTDAQAAKMGGDAPAYDLAYLVTSVRGEGQRGSGGAASAASASGGAASAASASGGAASAARVDDHKLFVWDGKSFVPTSFTTRGE